MALTAAHIALIREALLTVGALTADLADLFARVEQGDPLELRTVCDRLVANNDRLRARLAALDADEGEPAP